MKKTLIIVFSISLLFSSTPLMAEVVKNEMPACISQELLDEITTYIIKGEKDSYMPLLRSGQCVKLSPGMTVSVIDAGFFVSTIRYNGTKMYTPPKAIR